MALTKEERERIWKFGIKYGGNAGEVQRRMLEDCAMLKSRGEEAYYVPVIGTLRRVLDEKGIHSIGWGGPRKRPDGG